MKTSFVWSFSYVPERSIARSKNHSAQIHLLLDKTNINPVILAKVPKNFLGKVKNSLFYKLQVRWKPTHLTTYIQYNGTCLCI